MRRLAEFVLLFLLAGCGGAPAVTPTPTQTMATPSVASASTQAPSVYADIEIECDGYVASDFREFWSRSDLDLSMCEADFTTDGTLTADATEAYEAAGYDDPSDAATLHGLCAELDGYYATKGTRLSDEQIKEATGMLVLCRDFPEAATVKANITLTKKREKERSTGVRFKDGSYRVGKDIKPGTYVIRKVDGGCYWERLDKKGNIIDNNFIGARTRAEVTIRSSDYTFHSENCGEWVRT